MYKNGFGINNLKWLMYHKTKSSQTKEDKTNKVIYFMPFFIVIN